MSYYCKECETLLEQNDDAWVCPICGAYGYEDNGEINWAEDDDYDDIYQKSPGCKACDNPLYPDCQDSCKLFDD